MKESAMKSAPTQKTVIITIANDDLTFLKKNKYSLCFAKKVNGVYNVVWSSATDYLYKNTFSWTPHYQLFGSNSFQDSIGVTTDTNVVPIELGMQSVLDSAGVLGDATSGGASTDITLINNYGSIHPGVSAMSTDIHGNTTTTPIYVAPESILKGSTTLTPIETVQVWFEQNIQTGTMFSDSRSLATPIDLTSVDAGSRLFSNQAWTTPDRLLVLPPFLVIATAVTGALVVADLASKISAKLTGVYASFTVEVQAAADKKVMISYKQKPGLTGVSLRVGQQLSKDPSTCDQLAIFALQALAMSQVGYTSFDAVASAA
jgi:hypothetical protein